MTDLWGTGLIEGLPPAVADEPWIRIMDKVYRNCLLYTSPSPRDS